MIARVVLVLHRLVMDVYPSDGVTMTNFQSAIRGMYFLLCNRGSFVFRLPPYKLRGERMSTLS
jgi:hypothetical protein